jgi:hypothetical protein
MSKLFLSGVPPFPLDLGLALRDLCGLEGFIETGTYLGDTARCVAPYFKRVVTIEGVVHRYNELNSLEWPKNVTRILGDSGSILYAHLYNLLPTLFWLDAHWISNGTLADDDPLMVGVTYCPLRQELQQIDSFGDRNNDVVMIDDARFFLHPPKNRGSQTDWPSIDEIVGLLPDRFIFVHGGVIVAVPKWFRKTVKKWVVEHPNLGDPRAPK